jgi:hypothetical protein
MVEGGSRVWLAGSRQWWCCTHTRKAAAVAPNHSALSRPKHNVEHSAPKLPARRKITAAESEIAMLSVTKKKGFYFVRVCDAE